MIAMKFDNAVWIWHNDCDTTNVYVDFDDRFTLDEVGDCHILISCDRNYSLSINDRFVNCGQYSDYEDLKYYDELDITPFVKTGENRLHITVFHQHQSSSTYRQGKPGLIFEVFSGENSILASSDETIAYKNSCFEDGEGVEHVSGQLGFSFHYDSRNEALRAGEKGADIVDKTYDLLPRPIKKLEIHDPEPAAIICTGGFTDTRSDGTPAMRMQSAKLDTDYVCGGIRIPSEEGVKLSRSVDSDDGILVLVDLGRESTGFLSLDIELSSDAMIYIGWGEHLADLRVRTYIGGRNFAASYYAKSGRNRFENPLLRCGARYVQLHIYAPEATIYYAGMRQTLYPLDKPNMFVSADTLHNRIYEVSLRTLHLCMHEHYEDCPWREQALYTMDSRNQMLCGYYAFGETEFARASLELMAHSLRDDNMLELCSPAEVSITIPSFSAMYLVQLYEYLEHSGDNKFVSRMLPVAEAIAQEFIRRIDPEVGLIKCFGEAKYWNFYEWQSGLEGSISGSVDDSERTYDAPLNAFVSIALMSLSKIYTILGDGERSVYYYEHRCALNAACDSVFFVPERGCYASYMKNGELSHFAELTNALLAYAGAVPDERIDTTLAALAGGELLPVTLSHSIFKYEALMLDKEKYARYVFSDIAKLWGHMLSKDATTFWETIDGKDAFGNAGSLCHGWSAIPVYIYFRYALGEDPKLTGIYEAHIES